MGVSETSFPPVRPRVRVLIPLPLSEAYDYLGASELGLSPGDFVRVPLGPRQVVGVVWDPPTQVSAPIVALSRLKAVIERIDVPAMNASLRRTIEWTASYTMAPTGSVLRMAMSVPDALLPARARLGLVWTGETPARQTDARRRVLGLAADGLARTAGDLAREAGVSPGVVRDLATAGLLRVVSLAAESAFSQPEPRHAVVALSPAQDVAARALVQAVNDEAFSVTLLEGVTGAGKTEVYFEAVAAALQRGLSSLVLLPEIALTVQWLDRFSARFGVHPALWHSDMPPRERRRVWRAVAEDRVPVVVGARSGLFLPFARLGLVVVDEEHDPSFKQEEGVIYHARDIAVVRAREAACPVVLVSATPSLETVVNAQKTRYRHLMLPERHGVAVMPTIRTLDLRRDPPPRGRWLSPLLEEAIRRTLTDGEQTLLFLNRRGYAPLTLCRACGHRLQCPNCQAWLVEHRHRGRLRCHHCDYAVEVPRACPQCGVADKLAACGPGVERLAEEVAAAFPAARMAIMASDTLTGPTAVADLIRLIGERQIDVLIGTQIVAKGHHFPFLTLVGVVDADLGMAGGDLRAAERTYQLLSQVAGRAGREQRPGQVFLQTYMPDHPVIQALASGDRERFIAQELAARQSQGMPPYGRLAALIVSSEVEQRVDEVAQALGRAAPRLAGVMVLGPAPAPLALLRGRHRRRLLVKAAREVALQPIIADWLARVRVPGNVRVQTDIDPQSFL
ncbi:MAG: primosomal protein N' [Alphaproteobacteria bacterium]|nr:primosomal protein N' [Alphaproteobacteria bacterium]